MNRKWKKHQVSIDEHLWRLAQFNDPIGRKNPARYLHELLVRATTELIRSGEWQLPNKVEPVEIVDVTEEPEVVAPKKPLLEFCQPRSPAHYGGKTWSISATQRERFDRASIKNHLVLTLTEANPSIRRYRVVYANCLLEPTRNAQGEIYYLLNVEKLLRQGLAEALPCR